MERNRKQIEKSIDYVEDVLENWTMWQTHHNNLTQVMRDVLSLIKELTEENERLRKNLETFKGKQKSLQKQIEVLSKENHLLLSKDFDVTIGDCHIVFSNGKKGNIYTFTEKDQIAKEMLEGE